MNEDCLDSTIRLYDTSPTGGHDPGTISDLSTLRSARVLRLSTKRTSSVPFYFLRNALTLAV